MAEPVENAETPRQGRVRVFGSNILAGPLLDSDKAETIVMYDVNGEPGVILHRMVDDKWVMDTKRDSDWQAFKAQFGV